MTDLLQFLNSPPDDPREPHASHSIPKPLKEVPVPTGVDHLMKRPDVDPDRIARMGLSMGGYPAPRGRPSSIISVPASPVAPFMTSRKFETPGPMTIRS